MSNITNYVQLLAEGNLGSENVDFFDPYGRVISNSPALQVVSYIDDNFRHFSTYGAKTNYIERNRRINGAYGPVYDGQSNWLNPVDKFHLYQEDKFYYLQDYVLNGRYSNLFIRGLTFFTYNKPNIYYQYYNASFTDPVPGSYYRVDILGNEYPYTRGGIPIDIVIQQFGTSRTSDKLYLSFEEAVGGHGYHSEYQMRIPISAMLFNDRLIVPEPPNLPPSVDPPIDPPVDQPPVDDPVDQPVDQGPPIPYSPYSNFGGDTTDTGPTPNIDQPINPYFGPPNPRYVDEYFPWLGEWRNIFKWY